MESVLLVGLSTRAAADSAAYAGFDVTALDAFADRDQHPDVDAHALAAGRFTATAAARAAAALPGGLVAYLSPFENHPRAVSRLAAGRRLLGNAPDVLRRARDPIAVADTFARQGFAVPRTVRDRNAASPGTSWLQKPLASGGGTRIGAPGGRLPRHCYLQEQIDGIPGSVAFVAAGGRAAPLGLSLQLVGDAALGADGYRYCGSIRVAPGATFSHRTRELALQLAECAARELGLAGVNGIDFVVRDGTPYPIEINPRGSASMELADRQARGSVFAAHAAACRDGALPDPAIFDLSPHAPASGKAIVFARTTVVIRETDSWLADDSCHDIPRPGERIATGQPICTVYAEGTDADACRAALTARAEAIYDALR